MKTEWILVPFLNISMEPLISWNLTSIWLLRMKDPTWQKQSTLEYNKERKSSEFRLLLGSEDLSPTPSQHSKAPSVSSCVPEMFRVQNAPCSLHSQQLEAPHRPAHGLSSLIDARGSDKHLTLQSPDRVRGYLHGIQSPRLSRAEFLCLCPGKEGPLSDG